MTDQPTPHTQLLALKEVLPESVWVDEIVSDPVQIWWYGGHYIEPQHALDIIEAAAVRWLHMCGFTTGTTSNLYFDSDMIGHRWIKGGSVVSHGQRVPALIQAVEWQVKNG